jgi:hypothetical protein
LCLTRFLPPLTPRRCVFEPDREFFGKSATIARWRGAGARREASPRAYAGSLSVAPRKPVL